MSERLIPVILKVVDSKYFHHSTYCRNSVAVDEKQTSGKF
jgi:hypothetical protein